MYGESFMQFEVTAADKETVQVITFSSVLLKRELLFLRTSSALFVTCLTATPTLGCIFVLLVTVNEHLLAAWEALLAFTTGRQLEVSCRSRVTCV